MISYEVYKIIHIVCILVVASCLGISYFSTSVPKPTKIIAGIGSLLLMVAGMGLLARTMPGEPWPMWVKIKLVIWISVAALGPILGKRLKEKRAIAFLGLMSLLTIAIFLAVLKPEF